jgi:hypothetical protein
MIDTRTMIGAAAAAVLVLAASPAAWAQQPAYSYGSAMGRVYRNPASGCGYGLGYSGPGCPYGGYVCSAPGSCYYRAGPGNSSSHRGDKVSMAGARRQLP